MNKPKLGDKFFFVVKNYKEARAITVYVKKVGSKYFWVGHQYEKAKCFWYKFCIEDHSDANQYGSYDLYKTEQDYRDHIEARKLFSEINKKYFTHSISKSVTLHKLKRIKAILEEEL